MRTVTAQEVRDLWLGGRAPILMFALSMLLSTLTYFLGTSQVLNFLEQREAVNLALQVAVTVGVLITLLISADAVSGERERGTLESLLLTPVSRRAIAWGKLAAALTAWLGAFVVSVPYLWALGNGASNVAQTLLLGLLIGTILAIGLGAAGLLISARSISNKVSLAVSFFLLLALFVPTQLPVKGPLSDFLARLNPVASALRYLGLVLVTGHDWTKDLSYLISPVALAIVGCAILTGFSPRLVRMFVVVTLLIGMTMAFPTPPGLAQTAALSGPTDVSFDRTQVTVLVGERFTLNSRVTNTGAEPTEAHLAHLNVASLTSDVYVDPEDWSADRSKAVDTIPPGETAEIAWDIQAVNAGSFDIYIVLLPNSAATAGRGPLIVSTPVHVTVATKQTFTAGGSLPVVIAMPLLLGAIALAIRVRNRRRA